MKGFIILTLAVLAIADISHSQNSERDAQIVAQTQDVRPDGFNQGFQTSNGIQVQESGQLKNAGREDEALVVEGKSGYISREGTPIELTYTADENGYHPVGAHLPTPPPTQPIPEAIARAIAYIAAHPPQPEAPLRRN